MPNPKPLLRLTLGLACGAAILWLGVGCGEDIDPNFPCGEDALIHAERVREVFLEHRSSFRRHPHFLSASEYFFRDDEGNWHEYSIIVSVAFDIDQEERLPPEDWIPNEIEGVAVHVVKGFPDWFHGQYQRDAESGYADAVSWKYDPLFASVHPDISGLGTGPWDTGPDAQYRRGGKGIKLTVSEKADPLTLESKKARIPECLDGVPVRIFEN